MLNIFELARLLTPGLEVSLQTGPLQTGHSTATPATGRQLAVREGGNLEIDGQPVRLAWHKALPLRVFICPACGRDCYRLHEVAGVWACRTCHGLDYSSRHRHRTIPGYIRALYLRRRIGASPQLFSRIEPKPVYARHYWTLVREIRAIESALVRHHLREDINDVLERRDARRARARRDR